MMMGGGSEAERSRENREQGRVEGSVSVNHDSVSTLFTVRVALVSTGAQTEGPTFSLAHLWILIGPQT